MRKQLRSKPQRGLAIALLSVLLVFQNCSNSGFQVDLDSSQSGAELSSNAPPAEDSTQIDVSNPSPTLPNPLPVPGSTVTTTTVTTTTSTTTTLRSPSTTTTTIVMTTTTTTTTTVPPAPIQLFSSIDMATVLTAFATKHPTKVKKRSHRIVTGSAQFSWIHNEFVLERYPLHVFNKWNEVIVTQHGDSVRPGVIHDWWWLQTSSVGIRGTYQKADQVFLTFDPMIEIASRIITPSSLDKVTTSFVNVKSGLGQVLTETNKPVPHSLSLEVIDTKGSIGKRWCLVIHIRDSNPQMPDEYWYFDLGPSEGVFNPEYGAIAYRHKNVLGDSGTGTWEFYGNPIVLDFHETHLPQFFQY